ncbi:MULTISPECIES: hypothetical protein [unclassified Haloferax]|jgi:hypothetical protein|uniref:hypothetical protein n=1 Tax=unclassified Haloferax TaxID=2625095 RepID=UPI002874C837|nr:MULTISPECIES: hypothetical protein [unclassified Haloferax]MDS0243066.1 hypothetical protein [Haloferax sp. S2CR25]MDS0446187.1 hypothetical protein [Haloferax sp. S2CR25-2]
MSSASNSGAKYGRTEQNEQTTLGDSKAVSPPERVLGRREGVTYRAVGKGVPLGIHIRFETVKPANSWDPTNELGNRVVDKNDASDVYVEAYHSPVCAIKDGRLVTEGDLDDPDDEDTMKFGGVASFLENGVVDFMPTEDVKWYVVDDPHR